MAKRSLVKYVGAAAVALALALPGARARAADVPISENARTHFAAGVALLQDPKAPRYEDAYREFKAAYAASPSYKILGNLGLCAMKIERDAEAIEAYDGYLKEAGAELTPPERAQIERDLLTLKTGVVRVTVSSVPPGASIVDLRTPIEGNDIRNAYGEAKVPLNLGLRRGHHTITARLAGYKDMQWEFEASGTTLPPHEFTMVKSETPLVGSETVKGPVPVGAWLSGGVSVAFVATGAVVGLAALQAKSKYDSENDGFHVTQANSDKNRGQTLNGVADAFFGGAVVAAIVAGYFMATRPTIERPVATTASLAPRVTPLLTLPVGEGAARRGAGAGLTAEWMY